MVILSLAVSTSSRLGLLISMSRNFLGLALALGVFLRTEYNRNRRFNFVGKEVPLVWSRRKHADCYSDSPAGTFHGRPKALVPACPSSDIVLEPCSRRGLSGRIQ